MAMLCKILSDCGADGLGGANNSAFRTKYTVLADERFDYHEANPGDD